MKYISTLSNTPWYSAFVKGQVLKYIPLHQGKKVTTEYSFREAVFKSIADDKSLFVPAEIPKLEADFINNLASFTNEEIALHLLSPFVKEDLSAGELNEIIQNTLSFNLPFQPIGHSGQFILELFHGPTWAFKDIGAKFLAGCLSVFSKKEKTTTILVATSGDTGAAVVSAFLNRPHTRVVVAYPMNKISAFQEEQIAGSGDNIVPVAIKGSFDDCQRLVKHAFSDASLNSQLSLTSANSINIARWLPQMVFYGIAIREAGLQNVDPVFAIPSGNYGNITAGILAYFMGLPVKKFIAAHNANDTIPRWLKHGNYEPVATRSTVANAMDVSDPGNFARMMYLWTRSNRRVENIFNAVSISDEKILSAIKTCWEEHGYLLDPHTATAWSALEDDGEKGIILATAHPQKFEEVIVRALGFYPELWKKTWNHNSLINRVIIDPEYNKLRALLLSDKGMG